MGIAFCVNCFATVRFLELFTVRERRVIIGTKWYDIVIWLVIKAMALKTLHELEVTVFFLEIFIRIV